MKKKTGSRFTGIGLGLSGCAFSSASPEQTAATQAKQAVTLEVVTSYGGDDGSRGTFEAAVAAYEAATGNKVRDGSATSNEGWKAKVLADFETGSEPDVLFFFTNADADPIINAGRVISIEDIREVLPRLRFQYEAVHVRRLRTESIMPFLPPGIGKIFFVNKSVLEACGVSGAGGGLHVEQFLSDCETIKGSGYIPIACSLVEVPHYLFEFAVMNNGTVENHLEVPTLDENGNLQDDEVSRKWVAALNDIKELYDLGYFPPNTLTATDEETVSLFGNGKAAFLVDGSWQVGHLGELYGDKIEDMAVRFVPAKGERKATEGIGGISMGYFITRKAWKDPEKRDAAVQFVEMLTSNEILSTFIKTEVTALIEGASPVGLNSLEQSAAETNAQLTEVSPAVQDAISAEAKSTLFTNIQKVVTGQMTAEKAVALAIQRNE